MKFEVGQHVWLNIRDFKMPNGLASHFISKYVKPYEILHKLHPNLYTLKLLINFVAHLTFHVLKLKFFLCNEQRQMRPNVNVIKCKLVIEIKGILYVRQKNEEYLVKYKVAIMRRQYGLHILEWRSYHVLN